MSNLTELAMERIKTIKKQLHLEDIENAESHMVQRKLIKAWSITTAQAPDTILHFNYYQTKN